MKRTGREMTYDPEQERWMVELDGQKHGLHCGELFELKIGKHYIPCRLELGNDWYIVLPGAQFNLRRWETYKIAI